MSFHYTIKQKLFSNRKMIYRNHQKQRGLIMHQAFSAKSHHLLPCMPLHIQTSLSLTHQHTNLNHAESAVLSPALHVLKYIMQRWGFELPTSGMRKDALNDRANDNQMEGVYFYKMQNFVFSRFRQMSKLIIKSLLREISMTACIANVRSCM